MRYVISDTHFGHGNIIEYERRPFSTATEMDESLIHNWNEKVDDDDTVIHLGDVRHHPGSLASEYLDRLNGQILLVRGNHDSGIGFNAPVHTAKSCVIQHGRWEFYCEHQPVDVSGWQLHGHTHASDMTVYPFINRERKTINTSVEVIGYEPLALDELVRVLENEYDSVRKLQTLRENNE